MIYLDNAATTWPKPRETAQVVADTILRRGANPGRGSYPMARRATETVYECRRRACEFFGASSPESVIFTPSCTVAVNMVLKGVLGAGDHVIISDLEHNAVTRPVRQLGKRGITFSTAKVVECDPEATLSSFRRQIRPNTKLIFCTHASNVFGIRLPVEAIGELAARHHILFGIDCAQSAGTAPLDLRTLHADFLCMPAHKGLYGIMGLGLLIVNTHTPLQTVIEGGTGSLSGLNTQPDFLPDRFESGTLNLPGIAALDTGLRLIQKLGRETVEAHEMSLMQAAYDTLSALPGCRLYTARPQSGFHVPLLSFSLDGIPSDEVAHRLGERDIAVRGGLHCAGEAHRKFGTEKTGTVRICPSAFTSQDEMAQFFQVLQEAFPVCRA